MLLQASCRLAVVATVTSIDTYVFPRQVASLQTSLNVSCPTRLAKIKEMKILNNRDDENILLEDLATLVAEENIRLDTANIKVVRLQTACTFNSCA